LHIVYSDSNELAATSLLGIFNFVGNQLDPSGSWSFLFSKPHGVLSNWEPEVRAEFKAANQESTGMEKEQNLEKLHFKVLSQFIAVPIYVGSNRYFLSERVDASKWNKFDSRLRLYQLRIR